MRSRLLSWWLRPGMAAMQRLRLPGKLVLLAAPLLAAPGLLAFAGSAAGPALAAGAVVLWLYVALCFHQSLSASMRALDEMVKALCAGDLTQSRVLPGRDELADMARAMEGMTRRFSQLVSTIRSEAQLVAMAGDRLSASAHELHGRTEEQAKSLHQTSESMASLVTTVQVNASDAQEADGL
ncbi:MAG TPA: methyl-accepting chemotaxis protein, partial [Rhizobacter sp.]